MADSGYYFVHIKAKEVGRKASASLSLPSSINLNSSTPFVSKNLAMYAMFGFEGVFDAGVYYFENKWYLFVSGGGVPWQAKQVGSLMGVNGTLEVEPKSDGTISVKFAGQSFDYTNSSAKSAIQSVYNNGVKISEEITWAWNGAGTCLSALVPNSYTMGMVSFGNATINRINSSTFLLFSNCEHLGPYDANGCSFPSCVKPTPFKGDAYAVVTSCNTDIG